MWNGVSNLERSESQKRTRKKTIHSFLFSQFTANIVWQSQYRMFLSRSEVGMINPKASLMN